MKRALLILILCSLTGLGQSRRMFFYAPPAPAGGGGGGGAIAFANVDSEGKLEPSADPETHTHTIDSQLTSGYALVAMCGWNAGGNTVQGVTFDGSAMTQLATVNRAAFGGNYWTVVYGLAIGNKAAGGYTVSIDWDGVVDEFNAVSLTYNNVHQSASTGTAATNNGEDTTPTVNVSSASGELVVDFVTLGGGSGAVHGSQTQRWLQATSTGGGASEEAGAATVTMSWSQTSTHWTIAAVPLKPL